MLTPYPYAPIAASPRSVPRTLLGTGLGLAAIHLVLIGRTSASLEQAILSALFWLAIVAQVRSHLPRHLPQSRSATGLGALLVLLLLVKTWHLHTTETLFVRLFPLLAFGGWALMVRGWRLLPWWRPWVLVLALATPPTALPTLLERTMGAPLRTATAAVAAFVLHYGGAEVLRQGDLIQLAQGAVVVEFACTGALLLGLLLQVAVLLAAHTQWRLLPMLVAVSLGLAAMLSVVRVALMAAVVHQPRAFDFWHGGGGSQIITLVALAALTTVAQQPWRQP